MAGLFLSAESSRKAFPGGSLIYTHGHGEMCLFEDSWICRLCFRSWAKAVHAIKPLFPWSLDSYERGRQGSEGWPVVGHCR